MYQFNLNVICYYFPWRAVHFFLVIVVVFLFCFGFAGGGGFDRLEMSEPLMCVLICI